MIVEPDIRVVGTFGGQDNQLVDRYTVGDHRWGPLVEVALLGIRLVAQKAGWDMEHLPLEFADLGPLPIVVQHEPDC